MRDPLRLSLAEPPAQLPASLAEAKAHLRVENDQTSDDAIIMGHLRAAVSLCEQVTGRALMTQTWVMGRDAWPEASARDDRLWEGIRVGAQLGGSAHVVDIPKPPLQAVIHVKTFDSADVETIWPASNYFVDTLSAPGRLSARTGHRFPVPGRAANGIEIRFAAGYGDDMSDVPEPLRQGILRLTAHVFEHRGDNMAAAARASGAMALWLPYRVVRL